MENNAPINFSSDYKSYLAKTGSSSEHMEWLEQTEIKLASIISILNGLTAYESLNILKEATKVITEGSIIQYDSWLSARESNRNYLCNQHQLRRQQPLGTVTLEQN